MQREEGGSILADKVKGRGRVRDVLRGKSHIVVTVLDAVPSMKTLQALSDFVTYRDLMKTDERSI